MTLIRIEPFAAPRQTRRDKWNPSLAVQRYRAFKDELRSKILVMPMQPRLEFTLTMPASWSEKKRREMDGKPHEQKPDIDNLVKAVFDAMFSDDSHIWGVAAYKFWGRSGSILFRIDTAAGRTEL